MKKTSSALKKSRPEPAHKKAKAKPRKLKLVHSVSTVKKPTTKKHTVKKAKHAKRPKLVKGHSWHLGLWQQIQNWVEKTSWTAWMPAVAITVLVLFKPTATPVQLTLNDAQKLMNGIQFEQTSPLPGTTVAFRMKKGSNIDGGSICFRYECMKISSEWQLMPTNYAYSGPQSFVLEDKERRWTFSDIKLERSIFDQNSRTVAKLALPDEVIARIEAQKGQIEFDRMHNDMLFQKITDRHWASVWEAPIHSRVTSLFASPRTAMNGLPYAHTGVDYHAKTGVPVHASSEGVVVGVDSQVIGGNTVTVDHGRGVMTRYLHLSKFLVKIGDKVTPETVVGYAGATGRVEAPHVHWEIRVRGKPVDPETTAQLLAKIAKAE